MSKTERQVAPPADEYEREVAKLRQGRGGNATLVIAVLIVGRHVCQELREIRRALERTR